MRIVIETDGGSVFDTDMPEMAVEFLKAETNHMRKTVSDLVGNMHFTLSTLGNNQISFRYGIENEPICVLDYAEIEQLRALLFEAMLLLPPPGSHK